MERKLISLLIANLFAVGAAAAADSDFQLSGSVGIGGLIVNQSGAGNQWKRNEYKDVSNDHALSTIDLTGRGGSYYLDAYGENIGTDDQYVNIRGGQFGSFKYQLYDNEMRHVYTTGARSPLSPVGSSALTGLAAPNLNSSTWPSTYDLDRKRKDIGGNIEFSLNSPWYVRAEANQVTRKGLLPIGYAHGTSPGNGWIELPTITDYRDQNYALEGGYSTRKMHASLSWSQSKFSNGVQSMTWTNPFFGGTDTALLPPDNELTKIAGNVMFKQLPMNSALMGRFTQSKITNSFATPATALNTGGNVTTTPSSPTFNGEYKNSSASVALTTSWSRKVDTRAYWNWYRKDNNSTAISYAAGTNGTTAIAALPVSDLFNYRKNNVGLDVGYRVNGDNKLTGGLDWTQTNRERVDYNKTTDRKYYVDLRNSTLETVSGRIRYQYLQRRSDFQESFVSGTDASNGYFDWAVRRFDVSSFDQNMVKLVLDFNPAPLMDIGVEGSFKENKYKDTIIGRQKDDRQEYYASIAYGDPKAFRVSLFGDLEYVQYDSIHRYVNNATCTAALNCDVTAPASSTGNAFTWSAKNKDRNLAIGAGADWALMPRLTLKASYIYSETSGSVDFTGNYLTSFTNYPAPITNYDNTHRNSLNVRGVYQLDKQWELTGGYAYDRLRYSDVQVNNYAYVVGTGTSAGYLSGAYANPNYTTNIFYVMGRYKF